MRLEIYNNGPITAGYDICNSFYTFFNDANNAGKVYSTACSSSSSDYMGGHAVSIVGYAFHTTTHRATKHSLHELCAVGISCRVSCRAVCRVS
jgi:hypothetical protein